MKFLSKYLMNELIFGKIFIGMFNILIFKKMLKIICNLSYTINKQRNNELDKTRLFIYANERKVLYLM